MSSTNSDNINKLYFRDMRFRLSGPEEVLVRFLSYVFYIVFTPAAVILLFSDVSSLRWLGVLFLLFLGDRVLHVGQGERPLPELLRSHGDRLNVAPAFSPPAYRALSWAFRHARSMGRDLSFTLLSELAEHGDAALVFRRLGVSREEFSRRAREMPRQEDTKRRRGELLAEVERLAVQSALFADRARETYIQPRALFAAAALSESRDVQDLLRFFDILPADVLLATLMAGKRDYGRARPRLLRRGRVMNRALTSRPTPTLDRFSEDLTELARTGRIGFLVGREKEYERMLDALSRPGKPNVILVGEPGVGKTSLAHHLAYKIAHDDVPPALFDKRVAVLYVSHILSGGHPGEIASRLTRITEEIIQAGNVLVFVPDIHELFKVSGGGELSPLDVFLPVVRSGAVPLVGETYSREFKSIIEPRTDFLEQFEVIRVESMSAEETLLLLSFMSLDLEKQFQVFVPVKVLRKSVEIAERYITSRPLPSSALNLLKEAFGRASRAGKKILDEETLLGLAEEELGLPVRAAGVREAENLLHLEDRIHERFINQDEAVGAVAEALRQYRSGLSRRGGPIAVFLFVGPTGVGKTELSKILAEIQFGSREELRRFDMSEYQDTTSIFRLIGAPDGETTGDLTDTVREHPYSLILLDEFEKAHPDVLNLFLQVFDDGRLTDSLGRTVEFQNTIIVATSNAHSDYVKAEIEKGRRAVEIADDLKKKLAEYFKPELLNRFSDVIVFRGLSPEEIYSVCGLLLQEIQDTLLASQGIRLFVEDAARRELARLGYDKVFGARALRRTISHEIRGQLARMVLERRVGRGGTVQVSFTEGVFRFDTMK